MQIYKSTKCNDMRQTGYCPRGPFCAFAHVESKSIFFLFYLLKNVFLIAISHLLVYIWTIPGIPSTEETMNSLLTAIQSGSQAQLGSQQYLEGPVGEWNSGGSSSTTSSNGQLGSVGSFLFYFENSLTQLGQSGRWSPLLNLLESGISQRFCSFVVYHLSVCHTFLIVLLDTFSFFFTKKQILIETSYIWIVAFSLLKKSPHL